MLTVNNLQLLDEVVGQHQSRIREMAKATRRHPVGDEEEGIGRSSLRVWIGDHMIAWGESIRGGLSSRPTVETNPALRRAA